VVDSLREIPKTGPGGADFSWKMFRNGSAIVTDNSAVVTNDAAVTTLFKKQDNLEVRGIEPLTS
jgi:hypothetical protein